MVEKPGGGVMKHILWLFKNSFKCLFKGDFSGFIEAWLLIWVHIRYPHKKLK